MVNQMLDRETHPEYTLVIGISDGLFETTLNISVIVKDQNDNIPTPVESIYNVSIRENIPINTTIISIVFNYDDAGDNAMV